jgi:plasmid replication initiation protein
MLKTSVDYVQNHYRHQSSSQGILLAQSAGYRFHTIPLQLDMNIAWFCTDDYQSRISMYEKGLLYMFSIPSFYGKGIRYALLARYQFSNRLVIQAKYALTHYWDRNIIGTGYEQINDNQKGDLYLQMRWKF